MQQFQTTKVFRILVNSFVLLGFAFGIFTLLLIFEETGNDWKSMTSVVDSAGSWNAQQNWQQRLNCLANSEGGSWTRKAKDEKSKWIWKSANSCRNLRVSKAASEKCLAKRWIFFYGDSSVRILFSALVSLLSGEKDQDSNQVRLSSMPGYQRCPYPTNMLKADGNDTAQEVVREQRKREWCRRYAKGLSDRQLGGPEHDGYFREWIQNDIRLTYVFHTTACPNNNTKNHLPSYLYQQFLLEDHAPPDLMVVSAGPWDNYRGRSVEETIPCVQQFIKHIQDRYDGPAIWMNLMTCHPSKVKWGKAFNERMDRLLLKNQNQRTFPWYLMNRAITSLNVPSEMRDMCEGWHAWDEMAVQHAEWILQTTCTASE